MMVMVMVMGVQQQQQQDEDDGHFLVFHDTTQPLPRTDLTDLTDLTDMCRRPQWRLEELHGAVGVRAPLWDFMENPKAPTGQSLSAASVIGEIFNASHLHLTQLLLITNPPPTQPVLSLSLHVDLIYSSFGVPVSEPKHLGAACRVQ
jgi:hypothetical protein